MAVAWKSPLTHGSPPSSNDPAMGPTDDATHPSGFSDARPVARDLFPFAARTRMSESLIVKSD